MRPLCPASVNISSQALDHLLVAPEAPVHLLHHLRDLPRDNDKPLPSPDDGWAQGIMIASLQSPVKTQVGVKRVNHQAKKRQDITNIEIFHLCICIDFMFAIFSPWDCIRLITEELKVVSDECNGRVLPPNHVCRNVKLLENSAQ